MDPVRLTVYALHDLAELRGRTLPAGVQVVVSGHSHQPSVERRHGVLYVNPGSGGPRRFRLPVTAGELPVNGAGVAARSTELVRR